MAWKPKTFFGNYIRGLANFFTMGLIPGLNKGEQTIWRNLLGRYAGSGLTQSEQEANEFSAEQAQIQRDWESDEAIKAYERQREFYQDFQSPQAQVQQYQEAGLNPALMFGHGVTPASPVSGNQAAGGASAQSVKPDAGDIGQLISLMAGLGFRAQEVKAEKNLKAQQANYFSALAKGAENENSVFAERFEFWKQMQTKTLANLDADLLIKQIQPSLIQQNIDESDARIVLLNYQGLISKQDASDQKRMNQILYEVRQSARDLNQATAFNATSQGLESQQRLNEAKSTFQLRYKHMEEELRKLAADAGISESEFKAFWGDKRLNELLVMSEIFENYKTEFRAFGFGGSKSDWLSKLQDSTGNIYGLPSLAQPGIY